MADNPQPTPEFVPLALPKDLAEMLHHELDTQIKRNDENIVLVLKCETATKLFGMMAEGLLVASAVSSRSPAAAIPKPGSSAEEKNP